MNSMIDSLAGAFRLARFDIRGLGAFDGSRLAARASFRVIWPLLGMYLLAGLVVSSATGGPGPELQAGDSQDADLLFRLAVLGIIGQVIVWAGYLLLVHQFLRTIQLAERFFTMVAVYNWTLFWRHTAELIPLVQIALSGGRGGAAQLLTMVVYAYSLSYLYFSLRSALGQDRGMDAAMLVVAEAVLGFAVASLPMLMLPEAADVLVHSKASGG